MHQRSRKKVRRSEILTGLIIILVSFSYITSILLDFNFVSPYASLQEDLTYLAEQTQNQKISSISWLVTAAVTLAAIPCYLFIFHGKLRSLHILNGIFLLGAVTGFLLMGKSGLELNRDLVQLVSEGMEQAEEGRKLSLLDQFSEIQLFKRIGSSSVGLFAIGLSLTRFRLARFPLISAGLLLISGPVLIFFNWYDPEHLVRTGAMAGIIIGALVFSAKLINRGVT